MRRGLVIGALLMCFLMIAEESWSQRRRGRQPRLSTNTLAREAEYYFTEGEKYFILEDYVKAIDNFQKSISINPENSAAYYKMAQIEFQNDELPKALKNAQLAIEKDKNNKYYYLLIIEILTQDAKFDEAAAAYDAMVNNVPGSEHYLYELAAIYSFQDKYEEAIKVYNRLEDHFGFNERVAFERHKIRDEMGDTDQAIEELSKLVDKHPENETYSIALSEYHLNLGKDQQALEILSSFLSHEPKNPSASLLVGEIHRKNGRYEEATPYLITAFKSPNLQPGLKIRLVMQYGSIGKNSQLTELLGELCKTLIEVHPEEANSHSVYGDFLRGRGQLEEAAVEYEKSLELVEDNFTVWQSLILVHSQLEQFDKVVLDTDQALELYPNQGVLYYFSGYAFVREEMYQEAITMLKTGIRLVSNNTEMVNDFNSILAEGYYGLKQFDKCFEIYENILSTDPNNYLALNNYSFYLAERKQDLDKAEKLSSRLVKDNPSNLAYLDTHAMVLFSRKKYKEARKFIEKAVDSSGAKALYYSHYGDILFKLGEVDSAVEQWRKAKSMNSTLDLIDKKINDRKFYEN